MTIIVPRAAWGAAPPKSGIVPLAYPVSDVFLHHEAGAPIPADFTPEQECARMREIQAFTMGEGYTDFPYGVAVFPSGRAYEGRDLGFVSHDGPTAEEAATMNNNGTSVAVVWPGNYDIEQATPAQIQATADVITLAQQAGIVTTTPNIRGHRDVFPTSCPGHDGEASLPAIRWAVARNAQPPAPAPKPSALQRFIQAVTARPIQRGDRGPNVKLLQGLLNNHGARIPVNGVYDVVTAAAVLRFKKAHALQNRNANKVGRICILALLSPKR